MVRANRMILHYILSVRLCVFFTQQKVKLYIIEYNGCPKPFTKMVVCIILGDNEGCEWMRGVLLISQIFNSNKIPIKLLGHSFHNYI